MSRWVSTAIVLAILVAGVLAVLGVASGDKRDLAFATNVLPSQLGAAVGPGETACERAVHVDGEFDVLRLAVATFPPGPETRVTVSRSGSRAVLATGSIRPGFATSRRMTFPSVHLSRSVKAGGYADICLHVRGSKPVFVAGHGGFPGNAFLLGRRGEERRLRTDLHFDFLTTRPRSVLSQLPAVFHRAALFRADPIGAWTYWALLALLLVAVPALLVRALWTADRDAPDEHAGR